MTLVLNKAALIALDRNERPMWTRLKAAAQLGQLPVTHGGVVGQVWRGESRQARLGIALAGVDVKALDETLGRSAGELLAVTGMSDVIDAAVALLAGDGDEIVTLDRRDMQILIAATGRHVELLRP
ncbi:MAG: twitching motility protein PilT [Actinomycetota bacterium]